MEPKKIYTSWTRTAEFAAKDFADNYFAEPRKVKNFCCIEKTFRLQQGIRKYRVSLNTAEKCWEITVLETTNKGE